MSTVEDVPQDLFVVDDQDVHAVALAAASAGAARQLHDEAGALPGPALHPQVAAVPAHDLVADREPEARSRRG